MFSLGVDFILFTFHIICLHIPLVIMLGDFFFLILKKNERYLPVYLGYAYHINTIVYHLPIKINERLNTASCIEDIACLVFFQVLELFPSLHGLFDCACLCIPLFLYAYVVVLAGPLLLLAFFLCLWDCCHWEVIGIGHLVVTFTNQGDLILITKLTYTEA